MPEWTGVHQLMLFWQSGVLGVTLGFLFDFFNIPSKMRRRHRLTVFVCDVLFFVIAAMATFFFSLAVMDGKMHPLLFFGCLLGLILQHLCVGRLFSRMLYRGGRFVYSAFSGLFLLLRASLLRVFKAISRPFLALRTKKGKNAHFLQKKSKFFQKNS